MDGALYREVSKMISSIEKTPIVNGFSVQDRLTERMIPHGGYHFAIREAMYLSWLYS